MVHRCCRKMTKYLILLYTRSGGLSGATDGCFVAPSSRQGTGELMLLFSLANSYYSKEERSDLQR